MPRRAQSSVRWLVTSALLVAGTAGACWVALEILRPKVVVTEAVTGPVVQAFYSTGTVQPVREYPIKSNIAGTITQMLVDKGTRVSRGQPVAIVTDPALLFAAQKAQAERAEALARAEEKTSPVLHEFDAKIAAMGEMLDIAKREEKRISDMIGHNAGSQSDLDQASDRVQNNVSQLESFKAQKESKRLELQRDAATAQAAVDDAQWDLDQQTLKSPIDGVVLDRPIALGTRLAINDALMRIADASPKNLIMRAAVDEEDVAKVSAGQVVRMTLYAFAGQTFRGTVEKIYDQADPDRRTFEVDVKLDEPSDRLLPGMTGELAFIMAERDRGTVIPSQAVQGGAVYVVRDGRVTKRSVTFGIRSVERTEVTAGVEAGERVVISPSVDLSDGQRVRVESIDPVVAAGLNKAGNVSDGFKGFN